MEKNKIICPNCGAENECGGACQYCGSTLIDNGSHVSIVNKPDIEEIEKAEKKEDKQN